MKLTFRLAANMLIALSLWALNSCIAEDLSGEINKSDGIKEGYMRIALNLPAYEVPQARNNQMKSMNDQAESAISLEKLHLLVFKKDGGVQKFYYEAPVVSVEQDEVNPSKSAVVVKLVKSTVHGVTTKFDFMFVGNYDLPSSLNLVEGVTTKSEILEALKYDMPKVSNQYDKWNAATGSSTPFPMWGEMNDVEVKESGNDLEINMFRSLARIDVGLNFQIDGTKLTEEASGVEGYQISEVKVYRTYNSGQVTPDDSATPHIPVGAARRADDEPLSYFLDAFSDSYTREIYVPEADLPANATNDNMHCIVVGLMHEGRVSYYRLDFAIDADKDTRNYEAILRNHRYVFNILDIKGAGFTDAETALKSTPTANLAYEMIVWDETIHEMHVQGKYYFGLDNHEHTFGPKSSVLDVTNVHSIKYQTNYPISAQDGITLEWEKGGLFQAEWVTKGNKGEIKIIALTTNETNTVLTDVLSVKLGSFVIKVKINQEYINFAYTIDCSKTLVYGTYRPGFELNAGIATNAAPDKYVHYIEVEFLAEDESIFGANYEIYTEPIYGITFKASGTFTKLENKVRLRGEGILDTPNDARTEAFSVTIRSNSSSGSYCEATINPVIAKLNVLSIAYNEATFGYNIAFATSKTNMVLTSPNNFGPDDKSRVKIEGFNFYGANVQHFANNALAKQWLTGEGNNGQIADIVHIAWAVILDDASVKMLMEYMKKGGVLIALLQDNLADVRSIFRTIYNDPSIAITTAGPSGSLYPFPGHEIYRSGYSEEDWYSYTEGLLKDPIINGPFGDMRHHQWGEDASSTSAITSAASIENDQWDFSKTDEENQGKHTVIYTRATNLDSASPKIDNNITGLKYESSEYNMVWFGDGGFTSYNGGTSTTICPFDFDKATMFPTPRVAKYGHFKLHQPYNAPIFCNIMAWAIKRASSPELRAKKDALLGK